MERSSSSAESPRKIPEIQLNLRDVPVNSPQAFSDGLIGNIKTTQETLVAHIKSHYESAIRQHKYDDPDTRKRDENLMRKFIDFTNDHSAKLVAELRKNRNLAIGEQGKVASPLFEELMDDYAPGSSAYLVLMPLWGQKSFLKEIDQKIRKPIEGDKSPPEKLKMAFAPMGLLANKIAKKGKVQEDIDREVTDMFKEIYPLFRDIAVRYMQSKFPDKSIQKDAIIDRLTRLESSHNLTQTQIMSELFEGIFEAYEISNIQGTKGGVSQRLVDIFADFDKFLEKESSNYSGENFIQLKKMAVYLKNLKQGEVSNKLRKLKEGSERYME